MSEIIVNVEPEINTVVQIIVDENSAQAAIDAAAEASALVEEINNSNFTLNKQVATYALLLDIITSPQLTIVKVLNDENKGITNAIYQLWPDGTRMWIASVKDN